MIHLIATLVALLVFTCVHLFAQKADTLNKMAHGKLLSAGSGIAISYVFLDLLPKLGKSDQILHQAFHDLLPYVERHAYIMALTGFLLFYLVDKGYQLTDRNTSFTLSLGSYSLFNFLVGYAIVDQNNPEVKPLALFTLAIALHYFANDYFLNISYGSKFKKLGKAILIAALFAGWLLGLFFVLSKAAVALVSAFIGGGVIMNVTRHELSEDNPHNLYSFLLSSMFYAIILLTIG